MQKSKLCISEKQCGAILGMMRTPLSALIPPLSFTAVWKAITGHGLTPPHTHTFTCLFSASTLVSLCCPPTAPPPYLAAKPEPVNSWGRVSFDKWHQTPGSLPSCCHRVVPSVWTRTMWSDPTTPPPPEISGHIPSSRAASSPWMQTMPFRSASVQSLQKYSG